MALHQVLTALRSDNSDLQLRCPTCDAACYSDTGAPLATFRYVPLATLVARHMARPNMVELLSSHVDHVPPGDNRVDGIWGTYEYLINSSDSAKSAI
jgi:hypothetical protein